MIQGLGIWGLGDRTDRVFVGFLELPEAAMGQFPYLPPFRTWAPETTTRMAFRGEIQWFHDGSTDRLS